MLNRSLTEEKKNLKMDCGLYNCDACININFSSFEFVCVIMQEKVLIFRKYTLRCPRDKG